MQYTCRAGSFHRTWTHRLSGQTLERLDEHQNVQQIVNLGEVRKIQEYDGFAVSDPQSGSYDCTYCKIVPRQGSSFYLRNGSYVRPSGKVGEIAVNQNDEYVAFMAELKRRVANENPNVPLISGWLAASLVWWALVPLGIGFFAFAVGGFILDDFLTASCIATFCLPFGLILVCGGYVMGRAYWPTRTTAGRSVESPETAPSDTTVAPVRASDC